MCLRTTAPFLDSAKPLSLECRGRDLVCSISSLFNRLGHRVIDELAAVVGMKAANSEWKLRQHRLQHRHQPGFADVRGRAHHLPLRDLIDGVDVVHTFDSLQIALMHRVHTQVSGPPLRLRRSPLANRHRRRPGRLIHNPAFAVAPALPQPIQVRHRDLRQPLIPPVAEIVEFPLQDLLRRRTAQCLVGLIHARQQFDVSSAVPAGKPMPPIRLWLALPRPSLYSWISRVICARLSPVIFARYRRTSPRLARLQFAPVLLAQRPLHPGVNLFPILASNCTSSLASRNARICSRLTLCPVCTLTINSQHADSLLQAHLV